MNNYKLQDIEYIQNYILGGRADFIIEDENEINSHINFQVKRDSKDDKIYYVSFKSLKYEYIGYIQIRTSSIKGQTINFPFFHPITSKKFPSVEQLEKAETFRKLVLYIFYIGRLPFNLSFYYTGRCSVCNRTLTDPEYIKIGIGKVCLQK